MVLINKVVNVQRLQYIRVVIEPDVGRARVVLHRLVIDVLGFLYGRQSVCVHCSSSPKTRP